MTTPPLLVRLDARDRALFVRLALDQRATRITQLAWQLLTRLGGARGSMSVASLLALLPHGSVAIAWRTLLMLGVSHLAVQIVKRNAVRERPTVRLSMVALITVPDRFSFPSGHACAAMVVAAAYASVYPVAAIPSLALAIVVGLSRVMLGVHYPGDVVAGQVIALFTFAVMSA